MLKPNSFFTGDLRGYEKRKFVTDKAQRICRKLEDYPKDWPIAAMEMDDLLNTLENTAYIADAIRSAAKDPGPFRDFTKEEIVKLITPIEIEVGYSPRGYLRIITPLLVRTENYRSRHIGFAVENALIAFVEGGNSIPRPRSYAIVYKRFCDARQTVQICDSDNIESKKITNAIAAAMGHSDNAWSASFCYMTVSSPQRLTEVTVFPQEDLGDLPAYLLDVEPEGLV